MQKNLCFRKKAISTIFASLFKSGEHGLLITTMSAMETFAGSVPAKHQSILTSCIPTKNSRSLFECRLKGTAFNFSRPTKVRFVFLPQFVCSVGITARPTRLSLIFFSTLCAKNSLVNVNSILNVGSKNVKFSPNITKIIKCKCKSTRHIHMRDIRRIFKFLLVLKLSPSAVVVIRARRKSTRKYQQL